MRHFKGVFLLYQSYMTVEIQSISAYIDKFQSIPLL